MPEELFNTKAGRRGKTARQGFSITKKISRSYNNSRLGRHIHWRIWKNQTIAKTVLKKIFVSDFFDVSRSGWGDDILSAIQKGKKKACFESEPTGG